MRRFAAVMQTLLWFCLQSWLLACHRCDAQGSSLLKMAFMQKAMDKQRKRAKEEATTLLKELEAASHAAALEEEGESGSDQDNIGRKSHEGDERVTTLSRGKLA